MDRDGTIAYDVPYCSRVQEFELISGSAGAIALLKGAGFLVIVVTNQSGVARGYFTEETLKSINEHMVQLLSQQGAQIDGVYYCPHYPETSCMCRKPKPGMIVKAAAEWGIALEDSYVIGDMATDIQAARAAGCHAVLVSGAGNREKSSSAEDADYVALDLMDAAGWVLRQGSVSAS